MADYLPTELHIKILQKLPVKSLLRFTAVSKSWRSIITSSAFIASHLSTSKNQTLLLLRRYDKHDNRVQYSLLKFTEDGVNYSSSQLEFPFEFEIDRFRVVGSCGGLVCLSDDVFDNHWQPSIIIWNPSVRYHLVLPDPTINRDRKDCYTFVLGFGGGVANASHAYKVVRLVYFVYRSYFTPKVEIFSVKTMSWRRVRGVDVTLRAYSNMYCQVFFNGVVHWLSEKEPIDCSIARLSSILAFDIDNEVFGEVMLPCELANVTKLPTLHIFVIGESLGVVKYVGCACDVWVMKEYRVEESWTRLYTVDLMRGAFRVMGFRKCGEALLGLYRLDLDTNRIDLVSYNQDSRRVKDLGIYGTITPSFYVDNYVESLLLLGRHVN
ncbi:hypothetical protein ACP275_13G028600 [Erythranthe tilingii]